MSWPKPFQALFRAALLGAAVAGGCVVTPAAHGGGFAPDEVVVKLLPGEPIEPINLLFGTTVIATLPDGRTHLLLVPGVLDEKTLVGLLEDLASVEWAELNVSVKTVGGSTGSFFVSSIAEAYFDQYALDLLGVPLNADTTGRRTAVLDTGVDASHAVLAGSIAPGGFDFVEVDDDPSDTGNGIDENGDGAADGMVGHGTHLAGLIVLVAVGAEILPVRVLDDEGEGFAFQLAQGVHHAIEHGADVVNMSCGTPHQSLVLADALDAAADAGVVTVAAAGNESQSDPVPQPAGAATTIAVAGTDERDAKTACSNYGAYVTLAAPGSAIVGPVPGNEYGAADGTSFAAALVSAAATLLLAAEPAFSPEEIADTLQAFSVDIDDVNPDFEGLLGAGRLDIGAALPVVGDVNGDHVVDVQDLVIVIGAWGPNPGHPADLDGSGAVDVPDLVVLITNWS